MADCEFHQHHAIYADKMSPCGKRFQGRRHHRLAKQAWLNGHAYESLQHINMSIHFDPMNRHAVSFRDQIINNSPYGDESVLTHLRIGLFKWLHPLDRGMIAPWVFDQLGPQPTGELPFEFKTFHPGGQTPKKNLIERRHQNTHYNRRPLGPMEDLPEPVENLIAPETGDADL